MDRNDTIKLLASEKPFFSDVLYFDLEDRKDHINKHKNELKYICKQVDHYIKDVAHILINRMPISMISNLTYNLVHNLVSCYVGLTIYDYLQTAYLIDEDYDDNYELWKDFSERARDIERMISRLTDENVFNIDEPSSCENLQLQVGAEKRVPLSLLNLQHKLSKINGESLFEALLNYIRGIESRLEIIKLGIKNLTDEDFEIIYNANYALYVETYWPSDGKNFRNHIEENYFLNGESKIDILSKLLRNEKYDFGNNGTGTLWRDYFHNKKTLYFKMRKAIIDEDEWKKFFRGICRFEEYEKWIDELRNPPESDEDKERRDLLLRSNSIFDIQKMQAKGIDILKLYIFINKYFIKKNMKAYLWYALRRFLEKLDILLDCTNVDFKDQMNKTEWFEDAPNQCSDNAMNYYNFLNGKHSSLWLTADIPGGSRATPSGLRNVYNAYSDLEINEKELMR